MTRKRSGKTLMHELMHPCSTCHSLGFVKSVSNEAYTILRALKAELEKKHAPQIVLTCHPAIFNYLTNTEYNAILDLEKAHKCKIILASKDLDDMHTHKIEGR
jgi:Ribonuclease G/E